MQKTITEEIVRRWKKDQLRMAEQIDAQVLELREIERKIEAAAVLGLGVEDDKGDGPHTKDGDSNQGKGRSLPDIIAVALAEDGGSLTAGQVRQLLLKRGIGSERFGSNNNYLYTSLKRSTESGRIRRRAGKYRIIA